MRFRQPVVILLIAATVVACNNMPVSVAAAPPEERPNGLGAKVGDTVQMTGRIEDFGQSQLYLVTDWESRSRKTYAIAGNSDDFRHLIGKVIRVRCVIKEIGDWSGKIEIRDFVVE